MTKFVTEQWQNASPKTLEQQQQQKRKEIKKERKKERTISKIRMSYKDERLRKWMTENGKWTRKWYTHTHTHTLRNFSINKCCCTIFHIEQQQQEPLLIKYPFFLHILAAANEWSNIQFILPIRLAFIFFSLSRFVVNECRIFFRQTFNALKLSIYLTKLYRSYKFHNSK